MKVLIVDDVSFMLTSLEHVLHRGGHTVVTASSAVQGLRVLSSDFTVDAVISDLMMPDINGLEFYQRAQVIERFNDEGTVPPPPFILLTSFDKTNESSELSGAYREALRSFAATLHKPVEADELLSVLDVIDRKLTRAGREANAVHDLLQHSIERLSQARNRTDVNAVIDQLQQQLTEVKSKGLEVSAEG